MAAFANIDGGTVFIDVTGYADDTALMHAGLEEEVENLGNTLFDEVSRTANDIWNRV